jgi:cation transport regulator ChaC
MAAGGHWIFGYGSLLWRPDFPHAERRAAFVRGWARRLWQGSPDHRGVPAAPGRVATLVPRSEAQCWGIAYRVDDDSWDEVLEILDARESGGFERRLLDVRFAAPSDASIGALTYAGQVRAARGRSGSNADYVLQLAAYLRTLEVHDEHVFEVAQLLDGGA